LRPRRASTAAYTTPKLPRPSGSSEGVVRQDDRVVGRGRTGGARACAGPRGGRSGRVRRTVSCAGASTRRTRGAPYPDASGGRVAMWWTTIASCWKRWRGGDAAAGATLVRRHTAGLLRMFHGRVAAPVDAVQEVLLGCVRSRDRVPGRAAVSRVPVRGRAAGAAARAATERRGTGRRTSSTRRLWSPRRAAATERGDRGGAGAAEVVAGAARIAARAAGRGDAALLGGVSDARGRGGVRDPRGDREEPAVARAGAAARGAGPRGQPTRRSCRRTLAGLETWARALREDG
jgi:hypothetical protein